MARDRNEFGYIVNEMPEPDTGSHKQNSKYAKFMDGHVWCIEGDNHKNALAIAGGLRSAGYTAHKRLRIVVKNTLVYVQVVGDMLPSTARLIDKQ